MLCSPTRQKVEIISRPTRVALIIATIIIIIVSGENPRYHNKNIDDATLQRTPLYRVMQSRGSWLISSGSCVMDIKFCEKGAICTLKLHYRSHLAVATIKYRLKLCALLPK